MLLTKNYSITIDQGNTHCRAALFSDGELIDFDQNFSSIRNWQDKFEINTNKTPVALSSVNPNCYTLDNVMDIRDAFKDGKFEDMPVHYSETLGLDRLIQAYYLYKTQKSPCVLIDAGTFITVDFISNEGFEGGYIIPGIDLIRKTYTHGAQLHEPRLNDLKISKRFPQNTEEAMSQGTRLLLGSLCNEIKKNYANSHLIFISGGNAPLFKEVLPTSKLNEMLVHEALNFWLTQKSAVLS